MAIKRKMALMLIHKQLVKEGKYGVAKIVLKHLTGEQKNIKVINLLLQMFNCSTLI